MTQRASANGIEIAYDTFGSPGAVRFSWSWDSAPR